MDGTTIESDPRTAEYLRQKDVFARAMAELKHEARRREAAGYAVMAAAYTFEPAARDTGLPARAVKFSKLALIAAVGIIPNLLVISLLLN